MKFLSIACLCSGVISAVLAGVIVPPADLVARGRGGPICPVGTNMNKPSCCAAVIIGGYGKNYNGHSGEGDWEGDCAGQRKVPACCNGGGRCVKI
ncbi:hypothetical protein ISF_07851 [Cordyceps fumosorosea ARSEF 2679]|uniref:Hydrophobin 2 n=1 Tax=Cordyceps fumosorosea (strain ARSEF 2679) TaxID=1081104 RepID=A0A167NNA1_CORFA|nr:hypothetical protein ISF_07851 [Cordyceps fumosorosea ARSEF 2679]OAA55746.1 hypothetical protein ISF_07851 [Cordyceps fumosorosea ARSEF 2679]